MTYSRRTILSSGTAALAMPLFAKRAVAADIDVIIVGAVRQGSAPRGN